MRKSIGVLLMLLLLSGVLIWMAFGRIDRTSEEVTFTENVLVGDPEAARGTTFSAAISCGNQGNLNWDTSYTIGFAEDTITKFDFLPNGSESSGSAAVWLDLYWPINFGMSSSGELFDGEEEAFLIPAQDVASRTPAGKTHTEVVRLRDYYEFLPLQCDVFLPERSSAQYDESEIEQMITAFFKIPVPDDMRAEITVARNEAEQTVEINCVQADTNTVQYGFFCHCTVTSEGNLLLAVSDESSGGKLDFSQIPGGYGIYLLPTKRQNDEDGRASVPIYNALPLDAETVRICSMETSADEERLLLYTIEEERFKLHIVRISDMAEIQTIDLMSAAECDWIANFWDCSDFLVFARADGQALVLPRQGDGYASELTVNMAENQETWEEISSDAVFSYGDGALTCAAMQRGSSGVYIARWDASGLQYAGLYTHSLDAPANKSALYPCRGVESEGLRLRQKR